MQSENPAFDSLPNENNEDLNLHIPSEIFPNKELQRTDDTPLDNINPLDSALSTGEDEQLDLPPVLYLYEHRHIICDAKQTMIRIDKFLMDRLENVTRNKIQIAIRNNAVLVNEKPIKPNYKVRPNDVIFLLLPKKDPDSNGEVKPEDIPLDIRYEDDDVMVIYKPPGMVVHPGLGNPSGTLVNAVAWHLRSQTLPLLAGNPANRPGLVHRIDKNTSGLMVVAKNELAMSNLAKQFFDHSIHREYFAICWGEPPARKGTVDNFIGRDPANRKLIRSFRDDEEGGKRAITHYEIIEPLYYVSLVRCKLETGRTHQIRVHFSSMGNPLFSDARYGGDRILKGTQFTKYKQFVYNCFKFMPRQALHAKSLGFVHPRTGEKMMFESDLPADFNIVLDKWRGYLASRKKILENERQELELYDLEEEIPIQPFERDDLDEWLDDDL